MTIVGAFGLEPIENAPNSAAFAALAIQKAAERARRIDSRVPGVKIAVHAAQLMVGRVNGIAQIDLEEKHATETALAALSEVGSSPQHPRQRDCRTVPRTTLRAIARHSVEGGAGLHYRLTRLERTGFGLGGPTLARFVGRQRELSVVGDQLAQAERTSRPDRRCRRGARRWQVSLRLRADAHGSNSGVEVLSCRAFSYGVSTPSLPVVELLKGYFQIDDAETPSQIREKVSRKSSSETADSNLTCRHSSLCSMSWSRIRCGTPSTRRSDASVPSTRSSTCCCRRAWPCRCW